mgnify:CR=1 FL=1|tara:strand:- start:5039 stop:5323 length:285 start_codon:yes stop_codon:yes gene_type:complete
MKVLIWIHSRDAAADTITDYTLTRPYHDRHDEWVQVEITTDEFAQLRDKQVEERPIPDIVKKHKTITGGEFPSFWANLSIEEKSQIQKEYGWNY